MDPETRERLERLEAKVDQVVTFTGRLEGLLSAWMTGGRGKLLAALVKARGGT